MSSVRAVRVLLTALLVLVPAVVGGIAGSSVESEALGSPVTFEITVTQSANGTIAPGTGSVDQGSSPQYTITPDNGYLIADVLVDGSSVGAVTSHTFTNVTAPHTISATFAVTTHTITASAGPNGSISPSGAVTVNEGGSQTFTIAPATNYHIASVTVDGAAQALTSPYTFTSVNANHTITATFAIDTLAITVTQSANGTITPATGSVDYGATRAYTIAPATNYHIASVTVDGAAQALTSPYTFANVTAAHTITASFEIDALAITVTQSAHGTITPATGPVEYGLSAAYTIKPDAHYHIASVTVDGVAQALTSPYTFTNVTAAHTITATFAIDTHTITASAGANGSISPAGVQTVDNGAARTFTISPATGYYVADVLVDGVSVGPATSYTFTAVAANHTISAGFAPGVQTRLSISVRKTIVNYGSSTLLSGALYDSGDPLHEVGMGDRLVTAQSASSATGPWVDLETLTTSSVAGSVGKFALTVTPTGSTYYRLRFVTGAGAGLVYGGSISFVVRVGVRPVLGTPKVPSSVKAGLSFTVHGTLDPRFPAGQKTVQIKVYRYKNRDWVFSREISATNADSDGSTRYSVKVKLTTKGKYRFGAYTAPTVTWAGDSTELSTVLTVK